MGLEEYKKKRKFDKTPEPSGTLKTSPGNMFVIQKHRATRLHYDLRLEMEGVLRSWAVPKGPSLNPDDKRLAVQTEDHPIDYGDFEGVIPAGHYGAGKVIIWDRGTYEMVDPDSAEKGWKKGKLHFVLKGRKLKGEWVLVRGKRDDRQWIFFKVRDRYVSKDDVTEKRPESVVSGKTVEEVGEGDLETKRWHTEIERELERFGMKARGRAPLPRNIQPMLATLAEKPFNNDEWLFELKLDGIRTIVVKDGPRVQMWTRNLKSVASRFPHLAELFGEIPADSSVLDGEIVALDEQGRSRFNLIQPRIHLTRRQDIEEAEEKIPVYFYAFDLLHLNGYDLTKFPLIERKAVLRKLTPDSSGWLRYTDHVEARGVEFFKAVASRELEGVVAKRKSSQYEPRRSKQWLKIKTTRTDEFVVGGFTPPSASRKYFGALVLGLYDRNGSLTYIGKTGGGFDEHALEETYGLMKPLIVKKPPFEEVPKEVSNSVWLKPRLVCEVKFSEWTMDRSLRAPIFQRFRDDVDPKDCTFDQEQAEEPVPESPDIQSLSPRIEFSNLEKIFWPDDRLTKGDLILYYERISKFLVPHLLDRPLVLKRYPDGIHGEYFYQKDAPDYTPPWVRTEVLWSEDVERNIHYFIGADREQLLYLANLGAITQNPWSSRLPHLDHPDWVIFDLDPSEGVSFSQVQEVALELRTVLRELQLRAYPKTSGADGIHVVLPILERKYSYEDVRILAEAIGSIVVDRIPHLATIERVVARRAGKVYVDFLQNVRGKTVASVYSPRARPGAPVSTPLKWQELERPVDPKWYTIKNVFDRLDRFGDLFGPVLADRQDISAFLKTLKGRRLRR